MMTLVQIQNLVSKIPEQTNPVLKLPAPLTLVQGHVFAQWNKLYQFLHSQSLIITETLTSYRKVILGEGNMLAGRLHNNVFNVGRYPQRTKRQSVCVTGKWACITPLLARCHRSPWKWTISVAWYWSKLMPQKMVSQKTWAYPILYSPFFCLD